MVLCMFGMVKNPLEKLKNKAKETRERFDFKKLAIIQVEPINFTIRNENEKQTINNSFQKFLNSLDFPIQIVVSTNNLNLDNYISDLDLRVDKLVKKTKKKIFNKHFKSYKQHLTDTINTNSVLDRSFYLIVPEKESLEVQLGVIEQQLKTLNLKFKKLDTEETTQVLASCFNDVLKDSDKQIWC